MVAVFGVPETHPQSSCEEKHSSKFCKSFISHLLKMNGSSGWKYVIQTMPRKAASEACARGFLLPTWTQLTFTEGGRSDSPPDGRELGPVSWKEQEWRQSLIHNV